MPHSTLFAQFDIYYDSWLTNLFRQKGLFLKQAVYSLRLSLLGMETP